MIARVSKVKILSPALPQQFLSEGVSYHHTRPAHLLASILGVLVAIISHDPSDSWSLALSWSDYIHPIAFLPDRKGVALDSWRRLAGYCGKWS